MTQPEEWWETRNVRYSSIAAMVRTGSSRLSTLAARLLTTAALGAALSGLAATGAEAQTPVCPSGASVSGTTCTMPSGVYYSPLTFSNDGTAPTSTNGSPAGPMTVINNGQVSAPVSVSANGGGTTAHNDSNHDNPVGYNGGDGGTVTVTNNGLLFPGGSGTTSAVTGLAATSAGGSAGAYIYTNADVVTGGNGGNGSAVTVTDTANVISATTGNNSIGISAQSLGGNGGSPSSGGSIYADDEVNGGNGGSSGTVTVRLSNGAQVQMSPDNAIGILALSSGGGGGSGEVATDQTGAPGNGGNGGAVTITLDPGTTVLTDGAGSHAVVALSVGGAPALPVNNNNACWVCNFGSTAGQSGSAGAVTVTNNGTIITQGTASHGIVAESIGGTGGTGTPSGGSAFHLGNSFGSTTTGAQTTVTNTGGIFTNGGDSIGIIAQSIGGGGGVAYSVSGGKLYVGPSNTAGGDAGGNGGGVLVTNTGTVTTTANGGLGILAQSIGGGGGAGEGDGGVVAIGGSGEAGGNGGAVTVNLNAGSGITTGLTSQQNNNNGSTGEGAIGVVAQSIGGGGGNGGTAAGLGAAVGGSGGAGGNGGVVTVNLAAQTSLVINGDDAYGVVAQSIGGGGGNGGKAQSAAFLFSSSVGGSGGGGGAGGAVSVTNNSSVTSNGVQGAGIVAQTIGGGGGTGGAGVAESAGLWSLSTAVGGSGGHGGNGGTLADGSTYSGVSNIVTFVNNAGTVTTAGADGPGILAQSIGGGGGDGGTSSAKVLNAGGWSEVPVDVGISVAIGGKGGVAGAGGQVMVQNGGTVATSGDGAAAILAQSIGGGGGQGGDSTAASAANHVPSAVTTINIDFALGGSGGAGGNGGNVVVANTNAASQAITTAGAEAQGILAQSIGGGGGNGGPGNSSASAGTKTGPDVDLTIGLGGDGGAGSSGAAVLVCNGVAAAGSTSCAQPVAGAENPTIVTQGSGSTGILAQSIGGGGGTAGGGMVVSNGSQYNLNVGVGGGGGNGAVGSTVSVVNNAGIMTLGGEASGILAQSIGGGGGYGGSSDANAVAAAACPANQPNCTNPATSYQVNVTVGGTGGGAAGGGTVSVLNTAGTAIQTSGIRANGIVAQSIGGGGGFGGGAVANGAGGTVTATVTIGARGGAGGSGGSVTVENDGSISTGAPGGSNSTDPGSQANGIFAQSIGGGGGYGGDGSANINGKYAVGTTVGGSGGSGSIGGTVSITNKGSISTTGGEANGILAQSIGGGGGQGGSSDDQAAGPPPSNAPPSAQQGSNSYNLTVGVGGTGGSGNDGGPSSGIAVSVTNQGTIQTLGIRANGIFAQSVGGGGGIGGAAAGSSQQSTVSGSVNVGGSGGAGGNGEAVQVVNGGANNGTITTGGAQADAILAQSIGGGGGAGADGSAAMTSKINVGAGAGGAGGASGAGGTVTVNSYGSSLATQGMDAYGVFAQSVGGGGGIGAAGDGSSSTNKALIVAVGGNTSAASPGGAVTVNYGGRLSTAGARSFGIFAQSVGGGGGVGGAANSSALASVSLGGTGGAGGDGGAVNVNLSPNTQWYAPPIITTAGAGAHGVFAQSVGGGGGLGGDAAASNFNLASFAGAGSGSNKGAGNGGAVTVTMASDTTITTTGAGADGIFAQSVGGGGGVSGNSNGTSFLGTSGGSGQGGAVTINQSGTINASGAGSYGIFAQSAGTPSGSNTNGTISITVNGTVQGGSGNGAGIAVSGGNANNLIQTNAGSTIGTAAGTAIVGLTGADGTPTTVNISNGGTILGSVVEAGANAVFTNRGGTVSGNVNLSGANSVFNNSGVMSGNVILSGAYAIFNNNSGGVISPSGGAPLNPSKNPTAPASMTILASNIAISPSSSAYFNTWANGTNDNLTFDGYITAPSGFPVYINPVSLNGNTTWLIFNEYTNINPSRLTLNIAAPTNPAYQYSESASSTGNGASYVATYSVNITASFVPPGYALTRNETALAQELQSIWDAGSAGNPNPAYTTLFTSLARTTSATYPTSLDNLTSEFGAAAVAAVPAAAQSSATALMSCPGFEGISASLREEDCAWARTIGNWSNDAASNGFSGYRMSGVTTQIGGQRRVADGWFVGGLFGYGFNTYNANSGRENANGQEGTLGLVIKHQIGNWVFAAAVAGGWGSEKATRTISLPGLSAQASSGPGNDFILGRLRSYYEFAFQQWYVRPGVDLDVIRVHNPSYSETGAGALDLSFADASKTIFSATPGFEVGGRVDLGNGTTLRPYLNAGVSLLSSDSFKGSARLAAAPSAPPFSVSAPIPDKVGHVNLGVDLMQINAMEVKLEYGIDFANRYTNQTASLRLAYKF